MRYEPAAPNHAEPESLRGAVRIAIITYSITLILLAAIVGARSVSAGQITPDSTLIRVEALAPSVWLSVPTHKAPLPRYEAFAEEAVGLAVPTTGDSRISLRDPILYTTAWHIVGMGALLSMDRQATGFEPVRFRNVIRAMTKPPVWDHDNWYTNYIGHPVWGSETYLSVRRDGYSRTESLLFSTASSVAWEYWIEGWAEQPSIQDLLFTSTLGAVLGELRFYAARGLVRTDAWWSGPLLIAVDPFRGITNLTGLRIDLGMSIRPH